MDAIEASVTICAGTTILFQPFGADLTPDELLWLGDFECQLQPMQGRYQRLAKKNDQELLAVVDEQLTLPPNGSQQVMARLLLALVCEEPDLDCVRQLKEEIRTKFKVEVHYPDFLANRMKAMEKLRKWWEYLSRSEALLFYYGSAEHERLETIWKTAQGHKPDSRRCWYLAAPDIDGKRRKYPDALCNIDQVILFACPPA